MRLYEVNPELAHEFKLAIKQMQKVSRILHEADSKYDSVHKEMIRLTKKFAALEHTEIKE